MAKDLFQTTHAQIRSIQLNAIPHTYGLFHINEFRIYEDICKPYLTGQLVIETSLHLHERFLFPTAEVYIEYECPRSDDGKTRIYKERFRVLSYDSKTLGTTTDARFMHTISLIGQEYYNDRHNIVIKRVMNKTATAAAQEIHKEYMQPSVNSPGNIQIIPQSTGLIGQQDIQHAVTNKKPMKAIHDLLDRAVYAQWRSCAPTYFRRQPINGKGAYVIAPLQKIMEDGEIYTFNHDITSGADWIKNIAGYDMAINFKPIVPPSEHGQAVTASFISSLINSASYFNYKTKKFETNKGAVSKLLALPLFKDKPDLKQKVQQMLSSTQRGSIGSNHIVGLVDELLQATSVDKNGPGGYNTAQEAFLTMVAYSTKYWVTVPGQSGLNISAGDVIRVFHTINGQKFSKRLFVPRLIHEVKMTRGDDRISVNNRAVTEIYGVVWGK